MSALSAPPLPAPAPALLTVEEFLEKYDNHFVELVDGVVKEVPVPFPLHGKCCTTFGALLFFYAEENDSGHVAGNDSWIRTGKRSVRGADVCYFSYERVPKGPLPPGLLDAAPDLVGEVKSPSDTWMELFAKVGEYHRAGVRVVVILDPEKATASVYRPGAEQVVFGAADELTIPDVLPGFRVAVSRLFA
ncbi:MAG: Uma2 family endonuclease [Gemmataceae bacterium]|nr:Uma2 family endonuclease [Gemmataceae bacterium]